MRIIAFDPGRLASWAVLDTAYPQKISVGEVELIGSGRLKRPCPVHIAELLTGIDSAIVEEVGARPGQGESSLFTFGLCVGSILGAVSAHKVQVELVTPQKWKAASRLGGISKDAAKDAARSLATELWPTLRPVFRVKKNHGMAEAALMARWYFLSGPGRDVAGTAEFLGATD
jgi:crossover junction endodeoxyribonuclease RuvC